MKIILAAVLFLVAQACAYTQVPKYENLVFEGAGIRGIAYSGAIQELERQGITNSLARVAGTSAGAITAMMVSVGYNAGEIQEIISKTEFQKFNDGGFIFIGGLARLSRRYGWYKGNKCTRWLGKIIADKTGNSEITFRQLQEQGYKQLHVTGTCLNKQKLLVFSSKTYPEMKVKDAVRISMAIPLYYGAVFIDSTGRVCRRHRNARNLDIVVDGGITGNFPIFVFDSTAIDPAGRAFRIANPKTIGVRIDSDAQIQRDSTDRELSPMKIDGIGDYVAAFYNLVLENLNRSQLMPEDWQRTISVSSAGIGPKVRKLTAAQKKALIESGSRHTSHFLHRK